MATINRQNLQDRRLAAVQAWSAFVERGDDAETLIRPEILRSWELSRRRDHAGRHAGAARRRGRHRRDLARLPAARAVAGVEEELRRTAEDGDLVIAVTDADTRILWTYGGRVMRRKAESVNFVAGGRWDEASVGTNALAIAIRTGNPSMVFSAEHYASIGHNWVCWAAPVHDPATASSSGSSTSRPPGTARTPSGSRPPG